MEINKLTLTQIGLYNTQRVTDEQSIQLFSARKKQFQILMDAIDRTHADNAPQHQLIIAQRGMGKTTLLKRIEVELRSEPWCNRFIPLLFPEEQYNVKDLSEFWLNCIDALADVIELEHQKELVSEIDQTVEKLMEITNDNQRANEAHTYLINLSKRLKRRPVLLIDNLNLIFDRMNEKEQHTMRSLMSKDGAPIIIGASSVIIEDTINYKAPFYDAFRIHHLEKLTINELTDILVNLADITHDPHIISTIENHAARIKALYKLTGGNPRTAVMLFRLVVKGFSSDINDDLEALLDEATPIYKARFEELSDQMQIVIDAIAMNWEPITLEQLRVATRYENGQLSPQLKRLADTGWIEKPANRQGKGGAYEISERIFNIWFLMRRSSRRQKKNVFCLSKFMEAYYGEEIKDVAERCLNTSFTCTTQVIEALAVAKLTSDKHMTEQLYRKSREFIFDQSQKQPELLDRFDQTDLCEKDNSELVKELSSKIDQAKWPEVSFLANILIDMESDPIQKSTLYLTAGHSYLQLNQIESAEKYLKQSLELDSNNYKAYFLLAFINYDSKKNYYEAEKLCRTSMDIAPHDPAGPSLLGILYHKHLGDIQKAEQMYLKAMELEPNSTVLRNSLAELYYDTKDIKKAEKAYLESLEIDPDNESALFSLAYIFYETKKENEAIKYYKRVIKLDPQNDAALFNLALTYKRQKEYSKSERLFKKTVEINPKEGDAYYHLANIAELKDCKEQAISLYQKAIEVNNEDIASYINLSILYYHENKLSEAEKWLKEAIKKDIANNDLFDLLGIIYDQKGQTDLAVEYYKKSLSLEPTAFVYLSLARIYEEKQEFSTAEKYYLDTLSLDPDNGNNWKKLGNLYHFSLANYPKAEEAYLNGQKTKDHHLFNYSLIHLYRDKMNRTEEAKKLFLTLTKEDEYDPMYDLNRILFELRDKNEGNATGLLSDLLKASDTEKITKQLDHWIYFAAQVLNSGYSGFLLNCLSQNDYNVSIAPFYHAIIAASEKEPLIYLDSIPMEIRELAVDIMNKIKKYR